MRSQCPPYRVSPSSSPQGSTPAPSSLGSGSPHVVLGPGGGGEGCAQGEEVPAPDAEVPPRVLPTAVRPRQGSPSAQPDRHGPHEPEREDKE